MIKTMITKDIKLNTVQETFTVSNNQELLWIKSDKPLAILGRLLTTQKNDIYLHIKLFINNQFFEALPIGDWMIDALTI